MAGHAAPAVRGAACVGRRAGIEAAQLWWLMGLSCVCLVYVCCCGRGTGAIEV